MSIVHRIANLFSRSQVESEIDAELRAHLEMRTEDNLASGMSPEDARRDARVRFGNPVVVKEGATAADAALSLESVWADLRYALRQMRRSPGFVATSILILALGIGASTAIFSAVNPILFQPLPYPQAGRVMAIWEMTNGDPRAVTFATFHGLSEQSRSFQAMAVMRVWQPTMTSADQPERFEGQRVSSGYFRVLGVAPALGRDFQPADDVSRGPNVVILSDGLWRRRFGGDSSIVGHQVRLNDTMFTVLGVMPGGFENVLSPAAELWAPLQYDPSLPLDGREWGHHLRMAGRLQPGVSPQQARGELETILQPLTQRYAKGFNSAGGPPKGMLVNSLQSDLTQSVKPALLAVLGAVALVLLISCVNVTNLLLARGVQRRGELAVRAALGASPKRLIRQLLTESLLLASFGGALGLVLAMFGSQAIVALSPPELPRIHAIHFDGAVFAFAFGITTLIGIVVGLIPAWNARRDSLQAGMQHGSRRTAGGHQWTRSALVIAEVGCTVVLLVSAGLLLRSMRHLFAIDPGFDSANVVTMQVQESGRRFTDDAVRQRFYTSALDAVRQVPGVVSAGFTSQLPLSADRDVYGVEFEQDGDGGPDGAFRYAVTPGYVESMHIALSRGRLLNDRDIAGAPVAVLLNESFAKRKFGSKDPIGQRVRVGLDAGHAERPWATVVGVVGDVKQESLAVRDQDEFYLPTSQWAWVDNALSLVVRTRGDAAALAPAVRSAIWSVDKDQPVIRVATMDNLLLESEAQRRFVLLLFEAFALVGLVLAATGIYGVLAGSVTERTREIGVRTALGASRTNILSLVLRQGMTLLAVGVVIGMLGAVAAGHAIVAMLYGVPQIDPVTYAGVIALLIGVAAVACFVPARRAASVNPVDALREE
ncbi:MAG TPA: ABC transporter permease [Acidobacteriaceae bacterium]|jgi:putative ABC transport system permease protein